MNRNLEENFINLRGKRRTGWAEILAATRRNRRKLCLLN